MRTLVFSSARALPVSQTLPQYLETDHGTRLSDFVTLADWTANFGTKTTDTTHVLIGSASTKLTHRGFGLVEAQLERPITVAWSAAPTRCRYYFYVYGDTTDLFSIDIRFYGPTTSYYRRQTLATALKSGWNAIEIYPADWTTSGTPAWNAIYKVMVTISPVSDGAAPVVSFAGIDLNMVNLPCAYITCDDSYAVQYTVAFAYLNAHRLRASSFQIYTNIDVNSSWLSTAQLLAMQTAGWTVGTHGELNWGSGPAAEAEINACVAFLQGIGIATGWKHCAYPLGQSTRDTYAMVTAAGIVTGRTTSSTIYPYIGIGAANALIIAGGTQLGNTVSLAAAKAYADACVAANKIVGFFFHNLVAGAAGSSSQWNIDDFKALIDYLRVDLALPFVTAEDIYAAASGPVMIPVAI
jgi:hypothetical protein